MTTRNRPFTSHGRDAVAAAHAARDAVAAAHAAFPSEREADALAFVFRVAPMQYGAAGRIRQLLFAWHNAGELGGFDLADLWSLDDEHRAAALTLIGMIGRSPVGWYPSHYGYAADMMALIETYGPAR